MAAASGEAVAAGSTRPRPSLPSILGRRRPPLVLLGLGLIVGAAVLLPAAYLVIVFAGDFSHAWEAATSSRTVQILANTLGLTKEELERRTKTCGEKGAAKAPICWNGSPRSPGRRNSSKYSRRFRTTRPCRKCCVPTVSSSCRAPIAMNKFPPSSTNISAHGGRYSALRIR